MCKQRSLCSPGVGQEEKEWQSPPIALSHSLQQDGSPFGLGTSWKQSQKQVFSFLNLPGIYEPKAAFAGELQPAKSKGCALDGGAMEGRWHLHGERAPTPISAVHKPATAAYAICPTASVSKEKKYKDNFQRCHFPLLYILLGRCNMTFHFLPVWKLLFRVALNYNSLQSSHSHVIWGTLLVNTGGMCNAFSTLQKAMGIYSTLDNAMLSEQPHLE